MRCRYAAATNAEIPRAADSGTQRTKAPEAASPPTAAELAAPVPSPRTPASAGALTEACARPECAETAFVEATAPRGCPDTDGL